MAMALPEAGLVSYTNPHLRVLGLKALPRWYACKIITRHLPVVTDKKSKYIGLSSAQARSGHRG